MHDLINISLYRLSKKKIPNPELDLRVLLNHASNNKKDIILSNFNIKDIDINYFNILIKKRLNHEPISKIINKKYFWKDEFYVNYDVLDPRPESEIIIQEVLKNVDDIHKEIKILDIGTGSGCLSISIAKELKNSKITAIDISDKALKVAKKNIKLHNIKNQINIMKSDFRELKNKYDIVISNPPYLSKTEYNQIHEGIKKFEPKIAFQGGLDGLKFYRLFRY